jgi:rhodanese-related sulfurtransferase
MRSMQAIMMLESAGFSNLSNLEGGIIAWDALPK